MPKSKSKTQSKTVKTTKAEKTMKKTKKQKNYKTFKEAYNETREKVWDRKRARVKLHHSFRRSYREDYKRPLKAPGLLAHANTSLKVVMTNWKLFGALLIFIVVCNVLFVGIMS